MGAFSMYQGNGDEDFAFCSPRSLGTAPFRVILVSINRASSLLTLFKLGGN